MKEKRRKLIPSALAGAFMAINCVATSPAAASVPWLYCNESRCTIEVSNGLSFKAGIEDTTDVGDRVELVGDIVVSTLLGDVVLFDASLVFESRPDLPLGMEMYGTAQAPLPALPLLSEATFHAQPLAAVGLVSRDTLKAVLEDDEHTLPLAENPVSPDRPHELIEPAYLLFHFESGLSFDMPLNEMLGMNSDDGAHDPFSFSVPGDSSATFIFDPSEPYFFISQGARELALEKLEDAREQARLENERRRLAEQERAEREGDGSRDTRTSTGDTSESDGTRHTDGEKPEGEDGSSGPELGDLAFSWLGGIPFEPQTTWGIPGDSGHFNGHLYVQTTIPLSPFVELTGEVVTHISSDGFEQGGNGDVDVTFDLIPGVLNFSFPLGGASAGVKIKDGQQMAYFSGYNDPDYSFLPPIIPVMPSNTTLVAGYIDSENLSQSRVEALGEFSYDTSGFEALTGVDLSNLQVTKSYLSVSKDGVRLNGSTSSSIHPSIKLGGEVKVEIFFSPLNPVESYIVMRGEMDIAGVGLQPAQITVSAAGLIVEGKFVTPLTEIGVVGSITNIGPSLKGNSAIVFPLGPITEAIKALRKDVIAAQAEVDRMQYLIDTQRAIVQSERDRDAKRLADAQRGVNIARDKVNSLQSSINWHNAKIRGYKAAISSKYRWYKRQKWYKKPWAWAKYTAYRAVKYSQIAYHGTAIGGITVAKSAANAALSVAMESLRGVKATMVVIPVDADPRVAGLFAGMETAKLALKIAELALPPLPVINADFRGDIELVIDYRGARGSVEAKVGSQGLTEGRLSLGANPKACIDILTVGELCAPI